MRKRIIFSLSVLIALSTISSEAIAQKKKAKTPPKKAAASGGGTDYFGNPVVGAAATNSAPAATNSKSTGNKNASSDYFGSSGNNNTKDTSKRKASAGANIPVIVVPSTGDNPLTDTVKRSMKSENAIDRQLVMERKPLAYEHLREDDAVYRQQVWRVIDTREKMNLTFKYPALEDNGNQLFISILYRAVTDAENGILAFEDDRFSKPYSPKQFVTKFSGGVDTVDKFDIDGNVIAKEVRSKGFQVDSVYQYAIKEEWIFDKEASRMFVRILGIAPMMKTYTSTGEAVSEKAYPLFWIYYPDLRPTLAKTEVYNGKNFGQRMTWEDLFEGRMFSSFITRSTLDNQNNVYLDAYIKDPLFRLLEGENIKEKIFNYEQGLWSY